MPRSWNRAASRTIRLSRGAADLLGDLYGADLTELSGALAKLALFAGQDAEIQTDDIEGFLRRRIGHKVFEFTDAVSSRNLRHALKTLSDILDGGLINDDGSRLTNETALFQRLLPMINWEFSRLYNFKRLLAKGISPEEAARKLRIQPFLLKKFVPKAKLYSEKECLGVIDVLTRQDSMVKTGFRTPSAALEEAVIRIIGAGRKSAASRTKAARAGVSSRK